MNDLKFAFRQLLKNPGVTAVFMLLAIWRLPGFMRQDMASKLSAFLLWSHWCCITWTRATP